LQRRSGSAADGTAAMRGAASTWLGQLAEHLARTTPLAPVRLAYQHSGSHDAAGPAAALLRTSDVVWRLRGGLLLRRGLHRASRVPSPSEQNRAPLWLCRGKEAVRPYEHRPQRRGGEGSPSGGEAMAMAGDQVLYHRDRVVDVNSTRRLVPVCGARELGVG
jgi:hypothetical protein